MNPTRRVLGIFCILSGLSFTLPVRGDELPATHAFKTAIGTRVQTGALWHDRGNAESLNLFYGAGGKEHQPSGKFTFVQEDKQGTAPKFEVVDEQGVRWKAKLGEETQSETAATRLVWAAGYFTDEDYYLPELHVENMAKLDRGRKYVSPDGVVHGVRLERHVKGQKKVGNWSWFKNSYVGTKEFDGLRIMMALLNNWDLKEINNAIYEEPGEEPHYVISDLGATFGKTGSTIVRSKSNLRDYRNTKFIQKVKSEEVAFHLSSRPFFLTVFAIPNYIKRTKMQGVVKHIPRTHAQWLGHVLGQFSAEQIRDCFRAAGYSPEEVEGYAKVVQGRIADLNLL
jgi:hypothetical protein